MVGLLVPNVFRHIGDLRLADRKRAVTTLPIEFTIFGESPFYPQRAVAFNIANKIADIDCFAHRDQKVAVIRRAVTDDKFRFVVLDDAVNLSI